MNKFAFTTDWHIVFKQPGNRKDNVLETQYNKLEQFVDICNAESLDFIIHGGDLFDSPRSSDPTVLNRVISILRKLKSPMYYIPGSHDIYGYNLNSYKQAFIGTLVSSNCLNILNEKGIYQFPGKLYVGVLPAQINHSISDYTIFKDCDIIVTHNTVTDMSVPYEHILIKDLAQHFNKKIFLCGHFHKYFYTIEHNNLFINTGPLIRTSIKEANVKPRISFFVKDNLNINYYEKFIPVVSDVFNVQEISDDEPIITFNDVLQNTELVFSNVYEILNHVVTSLNIDAKYADSIRKRLENVDLHLSK